ncbi:AraC family transcriptional regulator [Streptomyces sp. LP11]|uniref:AraC family transcriptional regulator n=1 Tax=Streptomyces pyxinicus TaxID=2970331 RepID=A0ABT2B4J0_9ACTN|nr:AraC family transcriptional regulator [Streptomyces sp. LP11]MCS0603412.1 AraC family transcriptional regulator [Streptomyces sp. LP11]
MLPESTFCTEDLPASDRFEAWTQRLGNTHAPMHLSSERTADYRGHQRVLALGDVTVWPATFDHLVFHRTPRLVRQSDPEVLHLSLLRRGAGAASWGRQQVGYRIDDFHVNSSSLPYEISTGHDPVSIIGVEIPRTALGLRAGQAEQVVGRRVSGREGMGALLAGLLVQLTSDTSSYRTADAARLATVVTDLVTAVFAHALDAEEFLAPETHTRTLTLRIKSFVRQHLGDPDLTPASIAAAHHISRSYLYRLFQAEGQTVAAYIRDQRLAGAHAELTDPRLHTLPVHAIAARWGYTRPGDFTRAFRTAYGITPRESRLRALQQLSVDAVHSTVDTTRMTPPAPLPHH